MHASLERAGGGCQVGDIGRGAWFDGWTTPTGGDEASLFASSDEASLRQPEDLADATAHDGPEEETERQGEERREEQ